jgi:integrase
VKTRKLNDNPTRGIDPPQRSRLEQKTVDAIGFARLVDAAKLTDLANVVVVAIGTGMRRGELLGLRWGDVDLEAGIVRVRQSVEVVARQRNRKTKIQQR